MGHNSAIWSLNVRRSLLAWCEDARKQGGKAVDNSESEPEDDDNPEPEVYDKPELGPEVIAESVSHQEEIFPQPMEVEELHVETLVDLPANPTLKLVSLLTVMKV